MIVEIPELGTTEPKEAASLAGLAPITRESGKWKGRSKIGGGRRGVRNALYMSAVVAAGTGTRTLQYVCDFGDDWDHSIRIEKVNEAVPGVTYPRLLKASGACPPEDVCGAPGYEEFLVAIADPDHDQHDDMVRWSGGSFDPEDDRSDSIVERFDRLAKKWAPRPAKPKAPKGTHEHRSRSLRRMVVAKRLSDRERCRAGRVRQHCSSGRYGQTDNFWRGLARTCQPGGAAHSMAAPPSPRRSRAAC